MTERKNDAVMTGTSSEHKIDNRRCSRACCNFLSRNQNLGHANPFCHSLPRDERILGVFPLDQIGDVVAPSSEDSKLIIRVINVELVQPICPGYTIVSDRRTDRRMDDLR